MSLTVLSVAFPFAPAEATVPGGAEQVLLQLDRALTDAGHHSVVIACPGSRVAGRLVESRALPAVFDESARPAAWERHSELICEMIARERVDVVHMHGMDFHHYLPEPGVPVLATLHLPLDWYPREALSPSRARTWLHCVSAAQHATRPPGVHFLSPIENGVEAMPRRQSPSGTFALFLGRICPEKGVHLAIKAARMAGVPIFIAGAVFPYPDHIRYFEEEIAPELDEDCRFIGSVNPTAKAGLLANARCVLLPSLVEETSSLVAREAMAAGAPVIAFRRAALTQLIENGRTGFLVNSAEEMAQAIPRCDMIDRAECQKSARRRFPLRRMTSEYLRRYERMAAGLISEADLQ